MVTLPAASSLSTTAPNRSAHSSMLATSAIAGTFSRVTGSGVSNAAAIIGNAAFLFPGTR